MLAQGRFANDRAGYRSMKLFARTYRDRVWAVEGARGVGASLAQRPVAEGEGVLDVPARLSGDLQVVRPDDTTEILRMLTTRRQEVAELRIATVNRLHVVPCQLIPGGAKRHLSATKARPLLASVRPRDAVGKARKQLALDYLGGLDSLDTRLKQLKAQIGEVLAEHPTSLPRIDGIATVSAAKVLAEVGDVGRFPSRHHFASYTGTAPVDVSSGENNRHRLNRGGNRRLNHALHIAAVVQVRMAGAGQDYYRRKREAGKTHNEAARCLKRRISDTVYRSLVDDRAAGSPEGQAGASLQSSAADPIPMASTSEQSLPRLTHDPTPVPATAS
ncbi:MAG: transposase [Mycobacteriaceae bacterium]